MTGSRTSGIGCDRFSYPASFLIRYVFLGAPRSAMIGINITSEKERTRNLFIQIVGIH
jgi:hypothetical protein